MLAFDLETTGLCPHSDRVVCAAVCDLEAQFERVFLFTLGDSAEEFMALLDGAPRLCAFNGARFDLPFIQHQLGASSQRVRAWRLKLHDVYEACRLALDISFSLDTLLAANGLPGKTGSGADAINLAKDGKWAELGEYCLNDTRRTHAVSALDRIVLPRTHGTLCMDASGRFLKTQDSTSYLSPGPAPAHPTDSVQRIAWTTPK